MKQINEKQFIVGPVRLSYMSVFQPRHNEIRNKDEFSVTLLFPKVASKFQPNAEAEIDAIKEAVKTAARNKFGSDFKGLWASPLKDGDRELRKSDGEPKHPGYWYLGVRADIDYPPKLIDGDIKPAKSGAWESGDWGAVKIALYGYDSNGNKGVGSGLLAIQFLYKDEAFGGDGGANEEGFETVANAVKSMSAGTVGADEYDPFADE